MRYCTKYAQRVGLERVTPLEIHASEPWGVPHARNRAHLQCQEKICVGPFTIPKQ